MKALSYIFILILLVPIFLVTSCDSTKGHDSEEPKIEWIRFNMGDFILFERPDPADLLKTKIDTIWVNDRLNTNPLEPDTILLDRPLRLSGSFTDNMGLSAAVVRIWGDTAIEANPINVTDTCYRYRKVPTAIQMYGYTERQIENVVLVDKLPLTVMSNNSNRVDKELSVRESKSKNEYSFSVFCTDIEGNQDIVSFKKKPVVILTLDSFLKLRGLIPETEEPEGVK